MKTRHILLTFTAISALAAAAASEDERIEAILSQMSLEEKVGQLNQIGPDGTSPAMLDKVRKGSVGSILSEVDPHTINTLQHEAVENSRLGIPLLFARDVIHGYKTIFPIPLGQAATWNTALVEEGARIAADEASSVGIRWTFSPMIDISRDARWGRIAESAGEDPTLTAAMGVAMVKGYQGDDLASPSSIAACAKHFAGYGAAEGGRDYNTTWIPEPHLRDVYLRPYKELAKCGAATFMCSFNDINGIPSSGNSHLLRTILRSEWGYDGVVVSDWNSIGEMIPHGFCTDLADAAAKGANAGVDIDMESKAYTKHLANLVKSGKVSMDTLDELVRNVLRLKLHLGLFDNPYIDMTRINRFCSEANLDAARQCAEESVILLSNNGILPLKSNPGKIALIGPMANARHDQNGTWCFDMEKDRTVTPLDALTKLYGKENIIYAPGLEHTRAQTTEGFSDAVDAAKAADVVVYVCGEEAVLTGEAHCRADISLPGAQTALLHALKATGKPVVMVVMTGRPMTIANEVATTDATLFWFHPGTMGGPALANILSGEVNPSGKLPASMPKMVGQCPLYYSRKSTGRPARRMVLIDDIKPEAEQLSTGCTSYYLDAGDGPAFPFGYGLSYTTFQYSAPQLSATDISADGSLQAYCTVTNTGSCEGAETVQLYVRDKVASLIRPEKELKDFTKITLAPGESKTVTFTINATDLGFHNADCKYVVEPGEFSLWIAPDSRQGSPVKFTIK